MEVKLFNEDNVLEHEINDIVTRVKVFLINSNNQILIANCGGCYMLPGGHVEEDESLISTLKREMLEEAGIEIEDSEIKEPFFEVKHYTRNHRGIEGKNRLSKIIYYTINSNKTPDTTKINLTEHEKINNFQIEFLNFSSFENTLLNVIKNTPVDINRIIATETLSAFQELKKYLNLHEKN